MAEMVPNELSSPLGLLPAEGRAFSQTMGAQDHRLNAVFVQVSSHPEEVSRMISCPAKSARQACEQDKSAPAVEWDTPTPGTPVEASGS